MTLYYNKLYCSIQYYTILYYTGTAIYYTIPWYAIIPKHPIVYLLHIIL